MESRDAQLNDNSKLIAYLSEQLNILQNSVSTAVWEQILLLEEELLKIYDTEVEAAYHRGLIEGMLQRTLSGSKKFEENNLET